MLEKEWHLAVAVAVISLSGLLLLQLPLQLSAHCISRLFFFFDYYYFPQSNHNQIILGQQ
jgi:hypothetical protein